jgi:poly(A) polymerase
VSGVRADRRLIEAPWLRRAETQRILSLLDGAAGRTRAVGGIVRDTLLGRGRADNDVDLATELLPEEVMTRAGRVGIAAYPTGIAHGTVTLKLGALLAEVTTLREDVVTDGRHAVVAFGADWRRDAERRDFTMNALYAGMDGVLFDPLAGLDDCLARRVRFIGDPDQRIAEDRLRVFRFFRFSASHGEQRFDPVGLEACRRAADLLDQLSAERIGAEMRRMLGLPKVALTFETMAASGVLDLAPGTLSLLAGYEERSASPTLPGRLAIIILGTGAEHLQLRWRLANSEIRAAAEVLSAERLLADGRVREAAYRFPQAWPDALAIAAVRAPWDAKHVAAVRAKLGASTIPPFPLTGSDLLGLGYRPGQALGRELRRLEQAWIDSGFSLSREALLETARRP